MTKKASSILDVTTESEILDENAVSAIETDVAQAGITEDTAADKPMAEVTAPAKKKAATRKKAAASGEAKVKKAPAKRSRNTKNDKAENSPNAPVMKAFWGVFNPMMVQVAQYNYADEAEARKTAEDMTEKKKAPHFVQLIKKVM